MPHDQALYQWARRLDNRLPELPAAHRGWLAWASFGIALAQSAAVSAVALHLAIALALPIAVARQRLRELYQPAARKAGRRRRELDYAACFGPLLRWATAGWGHRRLALALDPTYLGDRFVILAVGVLYQSCAIPVAWHIQPTYRDGSWNEHWIRLLGAVRGGLGAGWEVLVLSDRGLESPELFRAIVGLGWHPLMRVKAAGKFRPDGWRHAWAMARFAAAPGRSWKGAGTAWPRRSRLGGTLLARWEAGHDEPWLVLTDLAPGAANVAWYGLRAWIEQGFKRLKSGGWHLQRNRMSDPDRLARWWAAVALATLWALESGAPDEALRRRLGSWDPGREPSRRVSRFRLGQVVLRLALALGREAPAGELSEPSWPADPWPNDPLDEQVWCQERQGLPL